MKTTLKINLVILATIGLLQSLPALALPDRISREYSTEKVDASLKQLLHDFHDAMADGEEPHNLKEILQKLTTLDGLKDWAKSFNLKRSFIKAYRFYDQNKSNAAIKHHLANLAVILPLSHALEMLSGPIMSSVSIANNWPLAVTGAISTVGAVISVPGLDPLCILIFSAYPLKPVQNTITYLREGSIAVFSFVAHYSGLKYAFKNVMNLYHHALEERNQSVARKMSTRKPENEKHLKNDALTPYMIDEAHARKTEDETFHESNLSCQRALRDES